jgi:calcium-dependent protein kinase
MAEVPLDFDDLTAALASEIANSVSSQIVKAVAPCRFNHENLVVVQKHPVQDNYVFDEEKLGEGSFGYVSLGRDKATGCERAIKAVPKKKVERSELDAEIATMSLLDHPNIVKLYEVFEDRIHIHMVMELCTGGELFQRIVEEECFSERQAAAIMQQVMSGLHYIHRKCVCHRDIKPENFLLCVPGKRWCPVEQCVIKIIDFGVAKRFEEGQSMTTSVGTPFYVSPQVLAGCYTQSCDLWSCGVLTYILLCGYPPFSGDTETELIPRIKAGAYDFPDEDWAAVSLDAKDLIRKLIMMDETARLTAEQAMCHTWILNKAPRAPDAPLKDSTLKAMKAYRGKNNLKKVALHVIAQRLQEDEIKTLKEMFVALDTNRDGTITLEELNEGIDKLQVAGLPPNMKEMMLAIDSDGSGTIDYTEFLAATIDQKHYQQENICWSAFQVFDTDGSGSISRNELEKVLASGQLAEVMGSAAVNRVLQDADADGDGQIDFDEFMKMMRAQDEL